MVCEEKMFMKKISLTENDIFGGKPQYQKTISKQKKDLEMSQVMQILKTPSDSRAKS